MSADGSGEESPGDDTARADAGATEERGERLQKVLARAGIASRRVCEELITAGRVEVNGTTASTLGTRVDPESDEIRVDGERVVVSAHKVYVVLNKPRGVVSTMSDPQGRRTLADFVGGFDERLFHVGRLDTDTDGLILLTNDGDLAHRLAHPSFGVSKVYVAQVKAPVGRDVGRRLLAGVELDDGPAAAEAFRVVQSQGDRALVELTLHEGRNRIVRRMLDAVGHPVLTLTRVAFGPLQLGALAPGKARTLDRREVAALLETASGHSAVTPGGPRRRRTTRRG
jgi:23S rRNA pseudouridine2605 synthase